MVGVDVNGSAIESVTKGLQNLNYRQQFLLNSQVVLLGTVQLAGVESNVAVNFLPQFVVKVLLEDATTELIITSVRLNEVRKVVVRPSEKSVLASNEAIDSPWRMGKPR